MQLFIPNPYVHNNLNDIWKQSSIQNTKQNKLQKYWPTGTPSHYKYRTSGDPAEEFEFSSAKTTDDENDNSRLKQVFL